MLKAISLALLFLLRLRFPNLGLEVSKVSHDPDEIIFNYSSNNLSKGEKSLHCKSLNFAIPPDKLEYSVYLLPFEL